MKPREAAPHPGPPLLQLESLEQRDVPALIGAPDPSFGIAGLVTSSFGVTDIANAVAVQPDGKIVVVGSTSAGNNFAVARYTAAGAPDPAFGGGDGKMTIDFGGTDVANAVVIQPDGMILVAGTTSLGAGDFAVARVLPDGTGLDGAFGGGGNGKATVDFGLAETATAMALRPNGRIVVGGSIAFLGASDFAIAQLTAAGVLDPLFGAGDGKFTVGFDLTDTLSAVAIQPDGQILVAGTTSSGAGDFAVARVLANGMGLDLPFGGGGTGKAIINFGLADAANAMALRPDGRIVVGGSIAFLGASDFAIAQLTSAGVLDPAFGGGDGKFSVSFAVTDVANAVALQPDGKIVAAGSTSGGGGDFAVARVLADGSGLDASFDTDGKATVSFGGDDEANDVVIDPNGRIVAVGSTSVAANFAVARLIGTVERGPNLAVGGSLDGKGSVFVPDAAGTLPAAPTATVAPFGASTANARVAVADVNGDKVADTILITGPGTPIRFAAVSGVDNTTLLIPPTAPFAGSEDFTGGGFVSAADFDHDGRAELIFTPDLSGGPRVTIFTLPVGGTPTVVANFFGIDDPNFRGGARTGAGDVDGDGFADLAVAAGFQGGPRIALFNGTTLTTTPTRLLNDFFAFEDTLRNGAYVSIGDLNGDGFGDLAFGAGPGGAPRLLAISGQQLLVAGPAAAIMAPLANFFVDGNDADRGGVRTTFLDADGDNRADLAVGSGEGSPANVRAYLGKDFTATGEPATVQDITVFGGATLTDGVFVG